MIKVAQCWDDGVLNDIKVADICRKYGAKATFNLNPGLMDKTQRIMRGKYKDFENGKLAISDIPFVYEGLKVASHTMQHANADKVPVADFLAAALDARHILEDLVQQDCPGFAWPCGVTTDETVKALTDAGFAYGRTTVNVEQVVPVAEPLRLHSNCHFLNPNFWDIFEKAKPCGIFYFWGHSYEMMDDGALWAEYEKKIETLSANSEVEWIDVVDIVK